MKRLSFVVGVVALTAIVGADPKSELTATYAKMEAALKAKDLAGVMKFFSNDFTWIDAKGTKSNKAQIEAQMKLQMSAIQKVHRATTKILKLTPKDGTQVARTEGVFEADLKLNPQATKPSRFKSVSITEDTWVKSQTGWGLRQVKTVKETMTLDGKPFGG